MKKEWDKAIRELQKLAGDKNCCIDAKVWGNNGDISEEHCETHYSAYIAGLGTNTYDSKTLFRSPLDAVEYIKKLVEK